MPLIINIADIPFEGQSIAGEILPTEMALPSDDGRILGVLKCKGHVSMPDHQMAHFQGMLTGRVARECVRCLSIFEEDVFLECDADFSHFTPSVPSPDFSKKLKKGSRGQVSTIDEVPHPDIDIYPITDSQLDLLPALREDLILATPSHPICQEHCAGLCQVCGTNLNEGVCECHAPVTASSSVDSDSLSKLSAPVSNLSQKLVQIRA